jgi:hypothetical protein
MTIGTSDVRLRLVVKRSREVGYDWGQASAALSFGGKVIWNRRA